MKSFYFLRVVLYMQRHLTPILRLRSVLPDRSPDNGFILNALGCRLGFRKSPPVLAGVEVVAEFLKLRYLAEFQAIHFALDVLDDSQIVGVSLLILQH